jgi:protein SDA1
MHIFKTTLSTLKDANKQKHKSPTLNRTVQVLLFSFVGNRAIPGIVSLGSTSSTPPGVWAVRITSEMWRKGIWNDARSVELMKEAACSDVLQSLHIVRFLMLDSSSCNGRGSIFSWTR